MEQYIDARIILNLCLKHALNTNSFLVYDALNERLNKNVINSHLAGLKKLDRLFIVQGKQVEFKIQVIFLKIIFRHLFKLFYIIHLQRFVYVNRENVVGNVIYFIFVSTNLNVVDVAGINHANLFIHFKPSII
jgi:hypothetical protein